MYTLRFTFQVDGEIIFDKREEGMIRVGGGDVNGVGVLSISFLIKVDNSPTLLPLSRIIPLLPC